ncbi:hypothetical protein KPATCC21470_8008 [Kitasatospora purpeofusca]
MWRGWDGGTPTPSRAVTHSLSTGQRHHRRDDAHRRADHRGSEPGRARGGPGDRRRCRLRSGQIPVRHVRMGLRLRAWMKPPIPRPSRLRSSRVGYWGIHLVRGC